MNAVIYARYSSDKQTEQSIDGQLRYCEQYAKQHGYTIVGTYIDRAISGTSDNRPQFQQMIADSSKKQFKFVIVWKLDRFARNRYDSAIYKNKLKKNGVKVLSATEGIGEGDESIILEAVLEAMAETYSKQLSQNVRRGLKESALKGNSTGGTIPLGYKLDGGIVDGGKRKGGKLVIDEMTAPIVKLVFARYAEGVSKTEIAKELNDKGYRTRKGTKFTINSFRTILENRKYLGTYHYDGIEVEGGCPALIDEALFNKCVERAKLNRRAPAHNKGTVEYILNGKLFCGHCGASMVGDCGTSKTGNRYYYYACATRKKKGGSDRCDKKREKKDFIEWYVVEQTVNYVLTPERIEFIAGRVVEEYNKEFSDSGIKELEKHLSRLENEFSKLTDSLINARSQRMIDKINEKADNLELQINDTEEELAKLRVCCNAKLTDREVVTWLKGFCTGDLMDMDFRRRIIEVLVNSIYLYDDKVVIYYNVRDGKQISYIDMLDETSDIFEDSESSDNMCSGSPKTHFSLYGAECVFLFVL